MKLLCIQTNNSITVYKVDYKNSDIEELINYIHNKYAVPNKEIIKTTFLDKTPISFGKLDNNSIRIKNYKITKINNYKENTESDIFFPETLTGEMEVNYEHYSNLEHILRQTFLTSDDNVLIDMTDLIKYRNTIYGINNDFVFDRTIDLNNKDKKLAKWDEKINTFTSMKSYNNHINNLAFNLNEPLEFINKYEHKKIVKDMPIYIDKLKNILNIEEVAMFPMNTIKKGEYLIIERFGTRNKTCNYFVRDTNFDGFFSDKLFNAEVDYNGANVIESLREKIIKNYDLDGWDYNLNALRSIKNNQYIKELK